MTTNQIANPTYSSPTLTKAIVARLQAALHCDIDIMQAAELAILLQAVEEQEFDETLQCHLIPKVTSLVIRQRDQREVLVIPFTCSHMADRALHHLLPVQYMVGVSYQSFPDLACELADAIVEAEQFKERDRLMQQKLDHSLYQITTSFEELTWLRSLAEHFELCSHNDGLARVGQATLAALRQLIYAQELVLLGIAKEENGTRSSPPLLAHDGEGILSEAAIQALFMRLTALTNIKTESNTAQLDGSSFQESIIVWNSPIPTGSTTDDGEVRNCILVPVVKSEELHGWLLAINKAMPYEAMLSDEYAVQDQNLVEFGTCEAGLMSTMAVMLATHTKNVNLLCEKEELLMGVLRALVSTIDAKDAYTGGHSDRVATFSKTIANQLGLPATQCEEIYMSGLLHDIGKIGVPDAVLGKPDRLTDAEFEQIKRHPVIGYEILRSLKPFAYLLDGVLHHHESFDGTGYPHGLAGNEIPLMGRIIAVADTYDAMTSNRTYRQGMPIEKAISILRNGSGKQWDPLIIDAFLESLERPLEC